MAEGGTVEFQASSGLRRLAGVAFKDHLLVSVPKLNKGCKM